MRNVLPFHLAAVPFAAQQELVSNDVIVEGTGVNYHSRRDSGLVSGDLVDGLVTGLKSRHDIVKAVSYGYIRYIRNCHIRSLVTI